jgi:hypothetical protein
VTGPNATWCVDFKGHFRTHDGHVCYPLTIIDAHSRFLIRCEGVEDPNGREVQRMPPWEHIERVDKDGCQGCLRTEVSGMSPVAQGERPIAAACRG